MTWVNDRHVGCSLVDADEHGWCTQTRKLTCTWCGHTGCTRPAHETGDEWIEGTMKVMELVVAERARQVTQYGHNDDLEDGTGQDSEVLPSSVYGGELTGETFEEVCRLDYEFYERLHGKPTWMHLIREEIAEAFQESDPIRLEEELVQVAALCVSWIETLHKRGR